MEKVKNPLHYQISNYDCGPTSVLNAISYLFDRDDIAPEIIRNTMLYCLDCYGPEGTQGKSGTSRAAIMFLNNWLNGYSTTGQLPIQCDYISGRSVYLGNESYLTDTLKRGGAAVVRLFYDEWHYVTMTGITDEGVLVFDPYYREEAFPDPEIQIEMNKPWHYNRIIPFSVFNREVLDWYSLGPVEGREALLIFNSDTKIEEGQHVEYFI